MAKTVAIVGGGPSGFAAARALAHEPLGFRIRIYERQSVPGGVWKYTGSGPMYQGLNTNVFKELMAYTGKPFAEDLPRFLERDSVLHYLEDYSKEIEGYDSVEVVWNTEVTDIAKSENNWQLTLGNGSIESADFVVVANGHYDAPNIPNIPGLQQFASLNASRVVHTRHYTNPEPYKDKKVLVIGNGSSGIDVTIQLLSVTSPITVSRHKESAPDAIFEEGSEVVWKPEAVNVDKTGKVTFSDGSIDKFDVILLATGYLYKLPFAENRKPDLLTEHLLDPRKLRVRNLYKYIFFMHDPTIAFVGLPTQIVPMPIAELQSSVIARLWANRIELPSLQEMQDEEAALIKKKGSANGYFSLGYPADVEYMTTLENIMKSASGGAEGFFAENWGPEKVEMRSNLAQTKLGDYKRKKEEALKRRAAH